ncbi:MULTISPECIES: pseudouridine synthase [unclassified Caloramator]|uniref:pseudouridine synthase n=1 Tax=unclassified Caloramator TaxID=2629145 RepID=UPI00237DB3B4|nr:MULTISPECIES: pseudouridine synthase [unclassified Caloramator]MDO6354454.1 pseudouridine synthase [Caloramator sp. CAR-1]WDU84150.1 pseudouridine synthase [Caloramator sp. Dgby_cultured_2]
MERIQKYIARCGVTSRRKAEELIKQGKVKVNGELIKDIILVDPERDIVEVNGKIIKPEEKKVYIMLNKPIGYVTTVKDEKGRRTVLDLIDVKERIYPVGRLDYDTSGLLILTNDGDFAYKLMHPSKEVDKVYIAEVEGIPTEKELEMFRNGLKIEDYITSKAKIEILKIIDKNALVRIVIHEGKNRQVRKMCEKIGHKVLKLKRVQIGKIKLGSLEVGKWRYLKKEEIEWVKRL